MHTGRDKDSAAIVTTARRIAPTGACSFQPSHFESITVHILTTIGIGPAHLTAGRGPARYGFCCIPVVHGENKKFGSG